ALHISVNATGEEDDDDEAFNNQGGTASITVEREFRGAGLYPRLDLQLQLGEVGSPDYRVVIEKEQPRGRRRKISSDQIRDDILNFLGLQTGRVGIPKIASHVGISRDKTHEILQELKAEGKVESDKQGVRLVR